MSMNESTSALAFASSLRSSSPVNVGFDAASFEISEFFEISRCTRAVSSRSSDAILFARWRLRASSRIFANFGSQIVLRSSRESGPCSSQSTSAPMATAAVIGLTSTAAAASPPTSSERLYGFANANLKYGALSGGWSGGAAGSIERIILAASLLSLILQGLNAERRAQSQN